MLRRLGKLRRSVVASALGAFAMQVAGCTSDEIQAQLANGVRTALNGIVNLSTTALVNEIFDIDD